MGGGLNLRKYIYFGGWLKPAEVEAPPQPYLPPVLSEFGVVITRVSFRSFRRLSDGFRTIGLLYRRLSDLCTVPTVDPPVAPLDEIALYEVHLSRKVPLDKCSHQGSAHWQQYALHGDPSHRGGSFP